LTASSPTFTTLRMTEEAPDSLIPYDEIVQEALRAVVGRVLGQIGHSDMLPGSHHFYITFKTTAPGVDIPNHLIARFPDEMTIVLQNKFWDLKVHDAAQNDTPIAEPIEDGSNVVAVDFKRKK